jgi:DnaK suppressor protein
MTKKGASLNKTKSKQFRQLLVSERAKLVAEIKSIAQNASTSPRDASGDLSAYTMHMADMAADTYERELSMNMMSTEHRMLTQIDDALKRIDEGTFGVCQDCQKAIAMSRLKAVPYASYCIGCQREREKKK